MKKALAWFFLLPLVCSAGFLLSAQSARAEAPPKVVKETWDAAYLEGAKVGWFRTIVTETEKDGKKVYATSVRMELTLRRYGSVVTLRLDNDTEETADGKITVLSLTQYLDQGKRVERAEVGGGQLFLFTGNAPQAQILSWNPKVIGPLAQERLPAERKVKPGDTFEYLSYELALRQPVQVTVTVGQPEEVDLLEAPRDPKGKAERVKKKLLRIDAVSEKVKVGDNFIELPKLTSWLDADRKPVRSELEMPFGVLTLYRSTEAVAKEEGAAPALLPDLGLTSIVPLNKRVDGIHDRKEVVYRITVKGDGNPATSFARDARQEADNIKGNTFELHVRGVRGPQDVEAPQALKEEYVKSNDFITSDDARVKELAAKAVGTEKDPWQKAVKIEKWVHESMTGSTAIGFATAAQVARDLKGDCRQHALLTAAMCRAAGVPSRTALGLVYFEDRERGPAFGFHMWTEVFVRGQWLGVDATLGKGGVGPGHLKINDHSWHDTQTLAPLLPVTRVLGKLRIEVVEVK